MAKRIKLLWDIMDQVIHGALRLELWEHGITQAMPVRVCPSPGPCEDTVTFGTKCIHHSDIGGFIIGALSYYLQIPWEIAGSGAYLVNAAGAAFQSGEKHTDADDDAIRAGYDYASRDGDVPARWIEPGGLARKLVVTPVPREQSDEEGDDLVRWVEEHEDEYVYETDAPAECEPCTGAVDPNLGHAALRIAPPGIEVPTGRPLRGIR